MNGGAARQKLRVGTCRGTTPPSHAGEVPTAPHENELFTRQPFSTCMVLAFLDSTTPSTWESCRYCEGIFSVSLPSGMLLGLGESCQQHQSTRGVSLLLRLEEHHKTRYLVILRHRLPARGSGGFVISLVFPTHLSPPQFVPPRRFFPLVVTVTAT